MAWSFQKLTYFSIEFQTNIFLRTASSIFQTKVSFKKLTIIEEDSVENILIIILPRESQ